MWLSVGGYDESYGVAVLSQGVVKYMGMRISEIWPGAMWLIRDSVCVANVFTWVWLSCPWMCVCKSDVARCD